MGEITVVNNITLDGVMRAPARPDEVICGGFEHGGWTVPYARIMCLVARQVKWWPMLKEHCFLAAELMMIFAATGLKQKDNPYTEHLNKAKKYVVSTTLTSPLSWQNFILIKKDVIRSIASFKDEGQSFYDRLAVASWQERSQKKNLSDRLVLLIFPIVPGTGIRIFSDGMFLKFPQKDSFASSTGIIFAAYGQPRAVGA